MARYLWEVAIADGTPFAPDNWYFGLAPEALSAAGAALDRAAAEGIPDPQLSEIKCLGEVSFDTFSQE